MLRLNYILLGVFTLSILIFFCVMPWYLDDLWYAVHLKDWREGVPGASLWEGMVTTWCEHIDTDNVRLANMVFVPFLALPKWVGSGLAALLWGVCMVWSFSIAGVDARRSPLVVVALFLWAMLLPWYDGMGVECFQFNYIYSTFLSLLCLRIFMKSPAERVGDRSPADAAGLNLLLLLTGFVCGIWHEGFTAPLICITGFLLAFYPQWRTPRRLWLFAGLCLGMVWFLAWPTSWHRLDNVWGEDYKFGPGRVVFIALQHLCVMALCIVMVVVLAVRRRGRGHIIKNCFDPLNIALMLGILCSCLIHALTTRTPRTGWWGEVLAVIVILRLLGSFDVPKCGRSVWRYGRMAALTVLSLLTFIHQGLVAYWAVRVGREFDRVVETHIKTGEKVVFADIVDEHRSPLICMYAPDFTTLLAPVNLQFINQYYHPAGEQTFIPVPRELRCVSALTSQRVPAVEGCADLGIRQSGGRMFMPTDSVEVYEFPATIDFGYTTKHNVRMVAYPFVSEGDGKRYACLYPWRRVVEMRLGAIQAVSPTP